MASIHLRQFDARVVGLQNLFDRETLLRQAIGAELAHADSVTPSAPGEDESSHPIVFVVESIDDEELFLQTEGRTDAAAANMTDTLRANDFQIDYPSRRTAFGHAQIGDGSDAAN